MMRNRRAELQERLDELRAQIGPVEFELKQADAAIILMSSVRATGAEASRDAIAHFVRKNNPEAVGFTIKELVVKVLSEHLPNGATSQQLLEFFTRQWGRRIMRTSLSPQLTRLKDEGKIRLEGKVWKCNQDDFEALLGDDVPEDESGEAVASPSAGGAPTPLNNEPSSGERPTGTAQTPDGEEVAP